MIRDPFADDSVEQLYRFSSGYKLTRDIRTRYEYSNLGGCLLGHVLARRAGMDYEALVRSRITAPLGMSSTAIKLSPQMKTRLAPATASCWSPFPTGICRRLRVPAR